MLNKIFISIASYRDPVLIDTVNSALSNAVNPDRLSFGLVIQDIKKDIPDFSQYKNMSIVTMHPREARGAGFARDIAISLIKDEQYFLQIDSHTMFESGWDELAIEEFNKAKNISKHDKIILSYFPPPFYVESNKKFSIVTNNKDQPPYPTRQRPKINKRGEWTAERYEFENKNMEAPELSSTILAGFVFSTTNLVKEVPYDPEVSFFGEEVCFAVRAWTRGWDIYSPSKVIARHFYFRNNYKKIWKDRNIRRVSWQEIEGISKEKQKRILCGIETGTYGAGNIRSIEQYEKFINIDFKKHYGLTN